MADTPQQRMEVVDQIADIRERISELLKYTKVEMIARSTPPVVQELVLAQRHLEDARMRFGVAEATLKGHDPWANKIEEKK
jgi:hypothetical protein